jgi:hypothetical protein
VHIGIVLAVTVIVNTFVVVALARVREYCVWVEVLPGIVVVVVVVTVPENAVTVAGVGALFNFNQLIHSVFSR